MVALLKEEFVRRVFEEGVQRIYKCLDMISEEDLWRSPNDQCNSIGNQVLHLCGNVRQWIGTSFGHKVDERRRSEEFVPNQDLDKREIASRLSQMESDIRAIIATLNDTDVERRYIVQGFDESGVSILVHVIEHFSYHVGQITLLTKMHTGADTGYYAGVTLE